MNMMIKYKALLTTLVFSFLLILIPDRAHGFVFDLAQTQLAALSERTGPFAAFFIFTFLFFVVGYLALLIATSLLQGIIMISPTALTVTGDGAAEFVRAGWNLSAGIVNLILVIAFIVIAFAVILGSEKIQFKKALPMLIIVALLVNFTLLFVGAGIDISNFLFNTIAIQFMAEGAGGGNILLKAITPLFTFSTTQITMVMIYIGVSTVALLVPYVNVAIQVAWAVAALSTLSSIIQFIFYGAIMWSLSAIFFLYFVVFLARIFIIQVLAIFAPLAFFCLIFDNTKKWWSKWLNALVEWLFVGVIFIFLMYIALALAPMVWSLAAPFQDIFPDYLRWFTGDAISHIVLLIYFIVIIGIAKSFVPAAANALISQVSGVVKTATPWAGAIAKGAGKRVRNQELERKERIKDIPDPKGRFARIGHRLSTGKYMSEFVRRAHNIAGTSVEQERIKDVKEKADLFKKKHGEDYGDLVDAFNVQTIKTPTDKMAALQYLSEGGGEALAKLKPGQIGDFIELSSKRGDSKTVKNAVKHVPNYGDVATRMKELEEAKISGDEEKIISATGNLESAKKIQKAMMSDVKKADDKVKEALEKLEGELGGIQTELEEAKNKNKPDEEIRKIKERISEKEKEIGQAAAPVIYKISAQSLKTQDVESLSKETVKNEIFLKAIVETRNIDFMKSIGDRKDGAEVTKKLNEIVNKMDVEGLKKANITLYNQIRKSPAGQVIFSDMHDRISSGKKTSDQSESTGK